MGLFNPLVFVVGLFMVSPNTYSMLFKNGKNKNKNNTTKMDVGIKTEHWVLIMFLR